MIPSHRTQWVQGRIPCFRLSFNTISNRATVAMDRTKRGCPSCCTFYIFVNFAYCFCRRDLVQYEPVTPPGRFRPIVSAGIFIIGKLKCRRPFLLRNICAHHSRFWNRHMKARISRKLGLAPQLAPFVEWLDRQPSFNYTTTFTVLSLCAYCMGIIRPESKWQDRCHALLKTATPFILRGMGVPADWETLALWQ